MTCIAAMVGQDDTIYMAGDRRLSGEDTKLDMTESKVFVHSWKYGKILVGVAGSLRLLQVVKNFKWGGKSWPESANMMEPADIHNVVLNVVRCLTTLLADFGLVQPDDEGELTMSGVILIGSRGKLYTISPTFSVTEAIAGFEAIGSGAEIALGALSIAKENTFMNPDQTLHLAIEAAAKYKPSVGGKIDIVELKPKEKES